MNDLPLDDPKVAAALDALVHFLMPDGASVHAPAEGYISVTYDFTREQLLEAAGRIERRARD